MSDKDTKKPASQSQPVLNTANVLPSLQIDRPGRSRDNESVGGGAATPTQQTRMRPASTTGVTFKPEREKSEVTQSSSLDGQKFANPRGSRGGSPVGSYVSMPPVLIAPPQVVRTFSGRHRQSGLFSRDDLSIDVSASPTDVFYHGKGVEPGVMGRGSYSVAPVLTGMQPGGDGEKRQPASLVGSSIGSGSLGSEVMDATGASRKDLYKPFRRKWRRFRRKYKGCIFALLSSLTSSLASYFVKELTSDSDGLYSPSYCLLWRYFGVLFPGIFIVLYYRYCQGDMVFDTIWPLKEKEPIKRFILSGARAVVDVIAVYLNYVAFEYLLQSETSTILNSKPIIVQLLAHYTLGEPWGVVPVIMSLFAAVGVLVMSRPPFLLTPDEKAATSNDDFVGKRLPGVLCSLGSMFLASIVYCILRYLKDVHYSVFSLFIGWVGLAFGIGMTLGLDEFVIPANWTDWSYFITVAVLVCLSSISIVIALQNEEAFVVSLVRSFDVIFSFMWEMCLKKKFPDWYRGGGACIILFCVVVIFFRKYLTHQSPESKVYRRFHWLTK